jgi:transcriptional regulator with XRE-family HTH domain
MAVSRRSMTKMVDRHLDICDRFKLCRLEGKMTQVEMAEVLGVTKSYIKMVEGRKLTPNLYAIKAMRRRLGRTYDWIIDGE